MATSLLLSVGDGTTSDSLDLLDATKHLAIDFNAPWSDGATRLVSVPLVVKGTTPDGVWANYRNIEAKLGQARTARGPYGLGTPVTLGVKLGAVTSFVYFDVLDGHLDVDTQYPDKGYLTAALTLVCLPWARGDAVTITTTGAITQADGAYATPGNTGNGGVFIAGANVVLGDCAAPARMVLSDTSTALVINRVRWARRAVNVTGAVTGDYDHIIDAVAAGAGSAATDGTTYTGAAFARLTPTADWQTFASFTKPTAAYLNGEFDPVLRLRDSSATVGAPTLSAATGGLPAAFGGRASGSAAGTASSAAPAWSAATLAGSTLAMFVLLKSRTVTLTTPTGWTAGPAIAHASAACRVYSFYIAESAARSGAETLTFSGSVQYDAYMREYVGPLYAAPLDQSITNTATTATQVGLTTGALAQANELILAGASASSTTTDTTFATTFAGGAELYDSLTAADVGYAYSTATTLHSTTHTLGGTSNWAAALMSFKLQQNVAAAMPAGNYQICVAGISAGGTVGLISNIISLTTGSTGAIRPEWTPPASTAGMDHYRIYFKRDANAWKYQEMPTGKLYLSYMLATESGATTGDPVQTGNVGTFRLGVALPSGTTIHWGNAFTSVLANSNWENVPAGSRFPAPPIVAQDAGTPQSFIFYLQGKHLDAVGTLDVDILALFAAPDGQDSVSGVAEVVGLGLATKRDWHIESRRDRYTFGYLKQTGTQTEAGELDVSGEMSLMPGVANWLTLLLDTASGVSVVGATVTCTVSLVYVPMYAYARGTA